MPALAEAVGAVPDDRWLFVEIKPLAAPQLRGLLPALAALLAGRLVRTRVLSSSERVLAAAERAIPGAARSLVFDAIPHPLPTALELSPRHTLVEALVGCGRPLHPWTVDDPVRMRGLAALGVASITSNEPALAVEVLHG